MRLKDLQKNWDTFGRIDPLWSILADPLKKGNKWKLYEFFKTGEKAVSSIMDYIKSIKIDLNKEKALDFGCGIGRLTQALANYFDQVYGIDIAPSMIRLANKYNKYRNICQYLLNERADLALFSADTFDFIYSVLTLQHMEPKLRILKPNGLIVFQLLSEPNPKNSLQRLKYFIKSKLPKSFLEFLLTCKSVVFNQPTVECYGLKTDTVFSLIEKQRGKTIVIIESPTPATDYLSFKYFVTK
jgi:2-polyprenyl-3-methyl-5-hydroxy-6-metoxy-1,4-benzoquinol methylase